ncbi:hypothetical protein A2382_03935 [Candidatus Woesebacteria bacterium RIFOXYB1_FULL_38_16]|uniref:Uncharacterized protein n=1 Tax=Candidatus Woesebacteria bacterium RIFOXYB1_FULL_38_16 TaxID=1802538 RepID=A0A1F8CVG5_9BACT|nr:MAG: hypothetical protein A2382_03935 [Candidatus Woesebacteria bacterium RIFOXYB1_FULL_38_16]
MVWYEFVASLAKLLHDSQYELIPNESKRYSYEERSEDYLVNEIALRKKHWFSKTKDIARILKWPDIDEKGVSGVMIIWIYNTDYTDSLYGIFDRLAEKFEIEVELAIEKQKEFDW